MTPRCATCKHWTPVIVDDEVVADVMGTCRESPAKLGKAADEWCGRWAASDAVQAEVIVQRMAWAHNQWPYRGMGAAYPMTVDHTPDAPRTWWRRIFR